MTATWGWRILVTVSVLLILNGVGLYAFVVETHTERTIGVLLAAFAALSLMVALEGLRHATRWAWTAMWVVVVSLAAVGAHSLRGDRLDVPATYFVLAVVALVGQVLAGKGVEASPTSDLEDPG